MKGIGKRSCLWFVVIAGLFAPAFVFADSNITVRIMAANLTGNSQTYGQPEMDILQGLKADVIAIQEFNYTSNTYGQNTPQAFREMLDNSVGTNYVYFRESSGSYTIPNGVISRYPILASGSWTDNSVANRGFAWAQIDLPGTQDLYIVSVHLLTTGSTQRNTEATQLKALIQANFPAGAWIVVAGDFNTDSRTEACMSTLETMLSDSPIPVDNNNNSNTSQNRNHPHDYVLPSFSLNTKFTSVVLPSHTFVAGLVFDSRVYTPLSDVPPVQSTDSSSAQHMAVIKDFSIPVTLVNGDLLSVTPVGDLNSSGHITGPFIPSSEVYTLSNSGNSNLTWTASKSASWVTLSSTSGTLLPGSNTTVTVSINANANSLTAGGYSDTVVFSNTTSGAGSTTRGVNLTVNNVFPVIITNSYAVTAEDCTPTNGVVDPGETVTLSLSLKNTGTAATSNLVATLLATSDVMSPSASQTYGVVLTNGTPVAQSFSFTAGGTCGGTIIATLQLQDGAVDLGTVSFSIPVGLTTGIFTQNFDSVTAPALPSGWATSATGGQSNWVTSTALADTAPNAAFSPDPGVVGDNTLDSPSIAINSALAKLSFRHNYSLAANVTNNTVGYDGGMLEIKIGGGSYTDIVAAGGSFVSGGYNATLSGTYSNASTGRQAWSGNSGGFTSTVVNLPAAAAGQNIRLRWRGATGNTPGSATSSGTLAFWNFDGSNAAPTTVAANLFASSVTTNNLGSGQSLSFPQGNPTSGTAISAAGFTTSAGPPTTSFPCFSFSILVSNGAIANLTNLSFDDRASGTGPTKFSVQVSTQAVFSAIYDSGIQTAHTAFSTTPMNSFALSLSNLTGTIYVRLYAYQASATTGTWRIDNLNIQGNVTAGIATTGTGWYVDSVSIQDVFCCTAVAPVADFFASPTSGTEPLYVNFTDNSANTPTSWAWDFGDGGTSGLQNPSHSFTAGTWSVSLQVSNPGGSSTTNKTNYITVYTAFQSWQIAHFGSTTALNAQPNADPDGDGMSNMQEFLAGTDPNDSTSALRITSITREYPNVRVTWTTSPGKTNFVQTADGASYSTNNFADLAMITNITSSFTNYLDVGAATNALPRYYRIRLAP